MEALLYSGADLLVTAGLNGRINRVPREVTANLAFTPAERDQFCNDYVRLALGLQVRFIHLQRCVRSNRVTCRLDLLGQIWCADLWLPDHEGADCRRGGLAACPDLCEICGIWLVLKNENC